MITGSATGTVTFTDGDGRLVLVESGVALATITSPDAAIYSAFEDVQVGPELASPPTSVAALVAPHRVNDNARPGEAPAPTMWLTGWDSWRFDGTHVVLRVNLAVQGPGVRIVAVAYHVTMHGHAELGPKIVAGEGIQFVPELPRSSPGPEHREGQTTVGAVSGSVALARRNCSTVVIDPGSTSPAPGSNHALSEAPM